MYNRNSIDESLELFYKQGYLKVKYENTQELDKLRQAFAIEILKKTKPTSEPIPSETLTEINLLDKLSDINNIRIGIIDGLNRIGGVNQALVTFPVDKILDKVVGEDQLIQKHVNLVIQRPGDIDKSELHRDYPGNSNHEIVIWVPLVDCTEEMSLYILDYENSLRFGRHLSSHCSPTEWIKAKQEIRAASQSIPVMYGECLIFMATLFHGSDINTSNRTRISFNFRIKNFFSPAGLKDAYSFWKVHKISKFTQMAMRMAHE